MTNVSEFSFDLPEEQIAQVPADRREQSRLLAMTGDGLREARFGELPALLPPRSLVVLNDAKVIPARLWAKKPTGGKVELLAIEAVKADGGDDRWRCMARSSKPLRVGTELALVVRGTAEDLSSQSPCHPPDDTAMEPHERPPTVRVVSERDPDGTVVIAFPSDAQAIMARYGELPLPPYIRRDHGQHAADRQRYQTVYARVPGAIAAPTAGLHFTPALLDELTERGHQTARLTLHVGPGTFAPVRAANLEDHVMHEERFEISEATAHAIAQAVREGRPVVAVGTTVVRALEAAAQGPGQVRPGPGKTRLFIRPGFAFQIVDRLVTNFHLPRSTLLMLVCAFSGYERVMAAYRHAVDHGFRFFSYGDAMLLSRAH